MNYAPETLIGLGGPNPANPSRPKTSIGIVIISYYRTNQSALILDSLLQMCKAWGARAEGIVVENGRPLPMGINLPMVVLENQGYGRAANIGISMIPNRDIYIVGTHDLDLSCFDVGACLESITAGFVDLCGPTLIVDDRDPVAGARVELPRVTPIPASRRQGLLTECDSLDGALVFFNRFAWDQLGGFREDYFLYWEDTEICIRARALGLTVGAISGPPIRTTSQGGSAHHSYYATRNAFNFARDSGRGGPRLAWMACIHSAIGFRQSLSLNRQVRKLGRARLWGCFDGLIGIRGIRPRFNPSRSAKEIPG